MRSIAHHAADTRRNLKGKTEQYIRGYIGRHVIRILTADDELAKLGEDHVIAPQVRRALKFLQDYALTEEE